MRNRTWPPHTRRTIESLLTRPLYTPPCLGHVLRTQMSSPEPLSTRLCPTCTSSVRQAEALSVWRALSCFLPSTSDVTSLLMFVTSITQSSAPNTRTTVLEHVRRSQLGLGRYATTAAVLVASRVEACQRDPSTGSDGRILTQARALHGFIGGNQLNFSALPSTVRHVYRSNAICRPSLTTPSRVSSILNAVMPSSVEDDVPDPWRLTVIRTEGLLFVRPGRSWRPVVYIESADAPQSHETALGHKGQSLNANIPLLLHHVDLRSKLDIKIVHQSLKHRKKHHLIASACVSLGDLADQQQDQPDFTAEVRLSCTNFRSPSIKFVNGQQQRYATLVVVLRAPTSASPTLIDKELDQSESEGDTLLESSSAGDSDIEADEPSPEQPDIPRDGLRRRRLQIRGYNVDTDEDAASGSEACSPYAVTPGDEYFPPNIDTWDPTGTSAADGSTESLHRARAQVPSDIPLHNGQHPTAPTRLSWRTRMSFLRQRISWLGNGISWCGASVSNLGEMALNQVTPYAELYEAQQADGHDVYDKVHTRLLKEWYAVAATLVALGGIDAATFGLAPDSIFPVDGLARHVVALGAITAGLGLFHDCVLLFSYSNINGERFRTMAQDVNGSYVTFSLHCRIPFVCMLISTMSLTVFLLSVAWSEWPDAVLAMSFLSGVLFSMQYLVYGCSRVPTLLRGRRRAVPDAAS